MKVETYQSKKAWQMNKDEFGEVTQFPIGRRFNISGEAQRIRVEEEGISNFFLSAESAQKWIDKKHKQIIKKSLSEGKRVSLRVLADYPKLATRERSKMEEIRYTICCTTKELDLRYAGNGEFCTGFRFARKYRTKASARITKYKLIKRNLLPLVSSKTWSVNPMVYKLD